MLSNKCADEHGGRTELNDKKKKRMAKTNGHELTQVKHHTRKPTPAARLVL